MDSCCTRRDALNASSEHFAFTIFRHGETSSWDWTCVGHPKQIPSASLRTLGIGGVQSYLTLPLKQMCSVSNSSLARSVQVHCKVLAVVVDPGVWVRNRRVHQQQPETGGKLRA